MIKGKMSKGIKLILFCLSLGALLYGCSAEVGSEVWCKDLKEKPKGEWSANEVGNFAKHCVFK